MANIPQIDNLYALIAIIATALIAIYGKNIDKLKFKRKIEKNDIDNYELTKEQFNRIEKHRIFNVLRTLDKNDFPLIYSKSCKKELAQKLFIYQMSERFKIHTIDLNEQVKRILSHKKASQNDIIDAVNFAVNGSKTHSDKYIRELTIPIEVVNIFNQWFNNHWNWYMKSLNETMLGENSYFDMVNSFLNHTCSFIYAVRSDIENNIDTFNGELAKLLANTNIKFESYDYLA